MLVIVRNIFHRPLHRMTERGLTNLTLLFLTDFTGKIETAVSMDKKLNASAKIVIDQLVELVNFEVSFVHVKVPGNGQMAVKMQRTPVLDDAQVMKVNPLFTTVGLQQADHFSQQRLISLIHDPPEGVADNLVAGKDNDKCKNLVNGSV